MKKSCYFRSDFLRLITCPRTYLAVPGVVLALFFGLENFGIRESVLDSFFATRTHSGYLLCYIFCAVPFASVFLEDYENHYIRYSINRGSLTQYTISKAIHIYLSSMLTMMIGVLCFCMILRCFIPWTTHLDQDLALIQHLADDCYGSFLLTEHYLSYCLMYSFHLGMLAGTLSIAASFLSLFIPSRMIILTTPILIHHLLLITAGMSIFSVYSFELYNKFFATDIQCTLFAAALSLIPAILLTIAIRRKLPQKL